MLAANTPAIQTCKVLQAMAKLAHNQMLLEARLTSRLDDYDQHLESIESQLGNPGSTVTPDRAMQSSQAIKATAFELEERTKKSEYPAIYGQLYREFGITSYKLLPANKFERAMGWLTEWYRRITGPTGNELPF